MRYPAAEKIEIIRLPGQRKSVILSEDVEQGRLLLCRCIDVARRCARRGSLRIVKKEPGQRQSRDAETPSLHSGLTPLSSAWIGCHSKNPEQLDRAEHASQARRYRRFQSEIEAWAKRR